jgi:histidinol phosphatase-like enzyme
MIIYIDIDETICHSPDKRDYSKSTPIQENIDKANKLYDEGHTIVYWTARGASTGMDWKIFTDHQLFMWGVRYHKLLFNKPLYDLFIDDKNMNVKDWV